VANADWLSIASGAAGSGSGAVGVLVAPNTGAERSGTLTIAGQTVTVTQAAVAVPCTYQVAPLQQSIAAPGGAGSPISVTAGPACTWTASTTASWITITSAVSQTGNGAVAFTVEANTGAARDGTLTIAGQTVTVSQAAGANSCTYEITPTSDAVGLLGALGRSVSVKAPPRCSWTASSNASWLTITEGASGTGNGKVEYSVALLALGSRTGTLTIAGHTFTVTQSGLIP
jgi:hypothetical protein